MKKLFIFLIVFAALAPAFSGCSKKSQTVVGDGLEDSTVTDENLAIENEKRWADGGNIPRASADGPFRDVHFDFDSSVVAPQYHEQLRQNSQTLRSDPTLHAEIEGHCDRRGTTEYNMALGERRARAVASVLASLGVPTSQLSVVSYGEEIPLDSSDGETAYAKNRRAHFAVYRQGAAR